MDSVPPVVYDVVVEAAIGVRGVSSRESNKFVAHTPLHYAPHLNGRLPEKDFVNQAWRGCYALARILAADVTPLLCFTDAFVEGRVFVRGVRVLPLRWLKDQVLKNEKRHDSRTVALAVGALGAATGCYPSAVPRAGRAPRP